MKGILTRGLAAVGTVLVWFPVAATTLIGAIGSIAIRRLRFDYLMPAELFPVALAGALLLLWAALRARARRGLIGAGLALTVGLLAGSQGLAIATGLASGETEPAGWPWALVMAMLAGYTLALAGLGVAGVLLLRDLSRGGEPPTPAP